jgi:biotin-dependent carboxylase-like uncharacterized protein
MLRVLSPGALATIQDLGREGYQRLGVPVAGAMDAVACEIANRLVGNSPGAACIEITAGSAAFDVLEPCVIAITGADLGATLNARPLQVWMSTFVRAGQRIEFEGRRAKGARAYLALAGGVDVPPVLGSRSTYLPGDMGRALQMDDVLRPIGNWQVTIDTARVIGREWSTMPDYAPLIRVLPGPHADWFDMTGLTAQPWRVSVTSNRIGLRLESKPLHACERRDIPSLGVFPGVVQVPPGGQPILLMADALPTGGYPIVAVAIQADLHRAAQLLPGDEMRFTWTNHDEAVAAWRELRRLIKSPIEEDEGISLAASANYHLPTHDSR